MELAEGDDGGENEDCGEDFSAARDPIDGHLIGRVEEEEKGGEELSARRQAEVACEAVNEQDDDAVEEQIGQMIAGFPIVEECVFGFEDGDEEWAEEIEAELGEAVGYPAVGDVFGAEVECARESGERPVNVADVVEENEVVAVDAGRNGPGVCEEEAYGEEGDVKYAGGHGCGVGV